MENPACPVLSVLVFLCWMMPAHTRPELNVKATFSTTQYGGHKNVSCINGYITEENTCNCRPCWEGSRCQRYVDYYAPRFLVHSATAVIPPNATGVVYRAWSTDEDLGLTCPLGPGESARCPCAAVTYQLFAPPGDRHFLLDSVTGLLTRNMNTTLYPGATYTYKLMVQGVPVDGRARDLWYDLLDLRIYVSVDYIRKIPWT
ncbi:uncharacterized protein [Macrobrachium rosenbergii]|uniref:uncharacterized protein n=1 Tax=Macrobrachium rosenbergii TaxID=79674 RepID=UPI0034D5D313